jgi:hypothetical protein
MALPDLTKPNVAEDIASFGGNGQPSPVAKLNYNVPLPGAYPIDRVVPVDLPPEQFSEDGQQAGTSLIDVGIIQIQGPLLVGVNPQRLAQFYRKTLPATARPSRQVVARVGGEVEPLLTDVQRPAPDGEGDGAPFLLAAAEGRRPGGLDVLDRRRVVAEPDDVEVQRRRTVSYIQRLTQEQDAAIPPAPGEGVRTTIALPVQAVGHSIQEIEVDPMAPATPRLALLETWELRSYLGDYGLGRTLQTFSLLPGERTTITVETWRTDAATREDASSVFDSSDIAAQTRFSTSLANETGSAFQDQGGWALSYAIKNSGGGNFGIVSASVSMEAGFAANHQEASQQWSNNLSQSASEHANQVNNSRRQAVEQSSTTTTATGMTTTTVREIANTNLRRVLNFVFRELNQVYETYVVLRDIKIAFYNGQPGSAEVVPLTDLRRLLTRHVQPDFREQAARALLALCAERLDFNGDPVVVLQVGSRPDGKHYEWEPASLAGDGTLDFDSDPLSTNTRWRFAPGPLTEGAPRQINGLITDISKVVLRTDNLVVESLLGQADALDPYASALQALDLESRQADTAWRRAETRRTTDALDLVANLPDGMDKIEAWTKVFPDEPEIEVVPVAAVNNGDNP